MMPFVPLLAEEEVAGLSRCRVPGTMEAALFVSETWSLAA